MGIGRFLVSLRKSPPSQRITMTRCGKRRKSFSQFTKRSKQYLSQARSGLIAQERHFSAEVHNYVIFPPLSLNTQAKNLTVHPSENGTRKQILVRMFFKDQNDKNMLPRGRGFYDETAMCCKASISHNTPEVQLEPILMDIMFPPLEGSV